MNRWIIVTICLLIVVLVSNNAMEIPDHLKKLAKKMHTRCQNQTNTPEELIKSALSGVLPNDKSFECYIQCLFDMIGIMDDANKINIEHLISVLPEELHSIITSLSQACGTKDGSDKCNIAYNTIKCYVENNPLLIKSNMEFLFD